MELQPMPTSLIESFEFSLPDIISAPGGVAGPLIFGKPNEGVQMSLSVKLRSNYRVFF
jgi:hypothetical protein